MKVLALKPGHDGAFAFVDDGRLVYSLESEKDSFPRYSQVGGHLVVEALAEAPAPPDIVSLGGWHKTLPGLFADIGAGYRGLAPGAPAPGRLFGREVLLHSSSHERSHIVGGVAMSPFDPGAELAVLVWEGIIGAFYRWSAGGRAITEHRVLDQPGARYSALFALADPDFPGTGRFPPAEYAGKLMALAGLADDVPPTRATRQVVASILGARSMYPFHKALYQRSPLHDCGSDEPELHRAARHLSDELFRTYLEAARALLPAGLPLVVTGGCGLNCDWNTAWRASGHFAEVFVPPCANDSGSAIGTAVDAAVAAGDPCRLSWDVYAGARFVDDTSPTARGWSEAPLDTTALSRRIDDGAVVAWVQGRCEIGPRALGHRSLLASATDPVMQKTLNRIKQREAYRPVAPVCLEEDLGRWFDDARPDRWMLHFRRVLDRQALPAVTHVDGTARVQSLPADGSRLRALLEAHRRHTGVGVLCNTSLNFRGTGFINRTSELLHYCELVGIDDAVVDDRWLRRTPPTAAG